MVNNNAIKLAISDLRSQNPPQYTSTAQKYKVNRRTLIQRFKSENVLYDEARSKTHKLLTNAQELVLIDYIRKLSDRGIHPTPQVLKNLVVEIVQGPVGGRWVERFQKWYENELTSVYLRNIDHMRKIADNTRHYEHYFKLVRTNLPYLFYRI